MARARAALRYLTVLLSVVLVAAACGGDDGTTVDAVGPDVAIEASPAFLASVAERSDAASYRFELDMNMRMDLGFEAIDIDPDEPFVYGAQASPELLSMTLDLGVFFEAMIEGMGDLGAGMEAFLPDGDSMRIDMVVDGETLWMRAPAFAEIAALDPSIGADPTLAPFLSLGEQWGRVDIGDLEGKVPASDLAALAGTQAVAPEDMLSLLGDVEDVTELGTDEIRGVAVTGLRGVTTFGALLEAQGQSIEDFQEQMGMGAGMDPITAREMEQAMSAFIDSPADFAVWVDRAGMLRRFEFDMDLGAMMAELAGDLGPMMGGMEFSVGYVMDIFDYGQDVGVEVPNPENPVDLTSLFASLLAGGATIS
ncbi:MAG: hypothetical protein AAFZ07_06160 [Actinomycetota bacterium]